MHATRCSQLAAFAGTSAHRSAASGPMGVVSSRTPEIGGLCSAPLAKYVSHFSTERPEFEGNRGFTSNNRPRDRNGGHNRKADAAHTGQRQGRGIHVEGTIGDPALLRLLHAGSPSAGTCHTVVRALSALRASGAPVLSVTHSAAWDGFTTAVATSLESHAAAWPAPALARLATELTSYAKQRALPRATAAFLSSSNVRRVLRGTVLAFLPQLHAVPPGLVAGMCSSLLRAGVTFPPLFTAVAGWLPHADSAQWSTALGQAKGQDGAYGTVNPQDQDGSMRVPLPDVHAWACACDPTGSWSSKAASRRARGWPSLLEGTPPGVCVQLLWSLSRHGVTGSTTASAGGTLRVGEEDEVCDGGDGETVTRDPVVLALTRDSGSDSPSALPGTALTGTASVCVLPAVWTLLHRLLPALRALAASIAVHGDGSLELRSMPSPTQIPVVPPPPLPVYDWGWYRKEREKSGPWRERDRQDCDVPWLGAASASGDGLSPILALGMDRLPQLLEALANLTMAQETARQGSNVQEEGTVEWLLAESARLACVCVAHHASSSPIPLHALPTSSSDGHEDNDLDGGQGASPMEPRHVASLLRSIATLSLCPGGGQGAGEEAALALLDRTHRLLAVQSGAAAAASLAAGGGNSAKEATWKVFSAFKPSELLALLTACTFFLHPPSPSCTVPDCGVLCPPFVGLLRARAAGKPTPPSPQLLSRVHLTFHLARDAVLSHAVERGGAHANSPRAQVTLLASFAHAGVPLAPLAAHLCSAIASPTLGSEDGGGRALSWPLELQADLAWGLAASMNGLWERVSGRGKDGRGPYVVDGGVHESLDAGEGEGRIGWGGSAVPTSSLRGAVACLASHIVSAGGLKRSQDGESEGPLSRLLWACGALDVYPGPLLAVTAGHVVGAAGKGAVEPWNASRGVLAWAASACAVRPSPPPPPPAPSFPYTKAAPYPQHRPPQHNVEAEELLHALLRHRGGGAAAPRDRRGEDAVWAVAEAVHALRSKVRPSSTPAPAREVPPLHPLLTALQAALAELDPQLVGHAGYRPGTPLPLGLTLPYAIPSARLAFHFDSGEGGAFAAEAEAGGYPMGQGGQLQAGEGAGLHLSLLDDTVSPLRVMVALEKRMASDILRKAGWTPVCLNATALRGAGGVRGKARYVKHEWNAQA